MLKPSPPSVSLVRFCFVQVIGSQVITSMSEESAPGEVGKRCRIYPRFLMTALVLVFALLGQKSAYIYISISNVIFRYVDNVDYVCTYMYILNMTNNMYKIYRSIYSMY